jgi:FMN phosphatase YigB (HAD superfamily)
MSNPINIVFLFDVDNTLIDNDRVQADLKEHLEQEYGIAARDRYWEILEICGMNWDMSITWGRWSVSGWRQFIAQTSCACRVG